MVGQTVSHFKILDKLGAGGMGEVYRAEDTKLRREVALKVLPADLAVSPERLERFQREALTLAALDHPNIVHIYSVESATVEDGETAEPEAGRDRERLVHFLTMQLVRGRSLAELIPEDGLQVDPFFDLAIPMADALRAAHEKGIIHRDLKPENVMVDEEGRVKVLDFGLAKLRLQELAPGDSELPTKAMTQEGLVLGTVPYMSPEQLQGARVDHRTDLFSFGILLYEMLCGRRPFAGQNTASLVSSILRDRPEPLADLKPAVPARLGGVVGRCLEKDPDSRYQTAEALRDELQAIRREVASGQAVMMQQATSVRPPRSTAQTVALLAVIVIVAAILSVSVWRGRQAPVSESAGSQITSLAVLPLQNRSGDPEQDYFVDGMTEALITDLSKISALKIISRTSVMRYKGTDKSLAEITDELEVDGVIEGSVIREGNQVAITAQLIEVATDQSLWAERYQRDLTSILNLQAEIAQAIAKEIRVTLTPEEETLLTAHREVVPEAYEAFLKGRFHLQRFTPEDFDAALQNFETALEIDPNYALGHWGVAKVWGYRAQAGLIPIDDALPIREAAISRALEIDDTLAEVNLSLASHATWVDWDWRRGEAEFKRTLELNPNYAEARIFFSHLLSILGRHDEGTRQAERAIELDPLNPFFHGLYGVQLLMAGRYDDAIEQFHSTYEMAPSLGFGHSAYWNALHHQGRYEEALEQAKIELANRGLPEVVEALGRGFVESGYRGAMRLAAETLEGVGGSEEIHMPQLLLAHLYDDGGNVDKALEWLERAFESHNPNMPYLGTILHSEELRSDPRYDEMLRRLNLPVSHRR